MESLSELRERRAFECRLTPDRALGSLDEAEAFLQDRALLTRTPDSGLPSLYEACHEEPYAPGAVGFGTWPATKWPWFGALTDRGHLCVAVHRGKSLLVSAEAAALLDPICRAETDRVRAADPGWRRLLDHLARVGPSTTEDLRTELSLKRQELKALRSPLERCGVIVARSIAMTSGRDDADHGGHRQDTELSRWDQAYQVLPAATRAIRRPGRCLRRSARRRRPRGRGRPRAGAAPLVLLDVVLDRHPRRRPGPGRPPPPPRRPHRRHRPRLTAHWPIPGVQRPGIDPLSPPSPRTPGRPRKSVSVGTSGRISAPNCTHSRPRPKNARPKRHTIMAPAPTGSPTSTTEATRSSRATRGIPPQAIAAQPANPASPAEQPKPRDG